MKIYARQGDLVIERLTERLNDAELDPRRDIVLAGDSSGHRHRLCGVVLVLATESPICRFRVLDRIVLDHEKADGHPTVEMEPGDYAVHRLRERGDDSDRNVED